jgi:hypothetical protein
MTHAHPLDWPPGWPRTPANKRRKAAEGGGTWDNTKRRLYRELELLNATNVVLSSNLELRLDGTPRADKARYPVADPGVAVYFELRGHQMTMARDAYLTIADNAWGLLMALTYLRGMERHGGAHMMERAFSGFEALPSPSSVECFRVLGLDANATADDVETAFRRRAKDAHPDRGGSHETMAELTAARTQALRTLREVRAS